jgi:hypothetical protein
MTKPLAFEPGAFCLGDAYGYACVCALDTLVVFNDCRFRPADGSGALRAQSPQDPKGHPGIAALLVPEKRRFGQELPELAIC